jgi:hypothetical protein
MASDIAYICFAMSAPWAEGQRVWSRHYSSVLQLTAEVARAGYAPIVPQKLDGMSHRASMRLDHHLVRLADVLVVHQSRFTDDSPGIARERQWARELNIPIVQSIEELLCLNVSKTAVQDRPLATTGIATSATR